MKKNNAGSESELRKIPGVDTLLTLSGTRGIFSDEIDNLKTFLIRKTLQKIREKILKGATCPSSEQILELLRDEFLQFNRKKIRSVINATGIVLHTNLGRAPLNMETASRIAKLAIGYCNLEFDLCTGQRGKRGEWITDAFSILSGAEKAVIVNNCAAAVFLTLSAFAVGKEVIISRGELVQIGGGFRIPDILKASGAVLVEVGTTNITTIADYERAITPNTALILKVHKSNFFVEGHTADVTLQDLKTISDKHHIMLVLDLGSGDMIPRPYSIFPDETKVQDSVIKGSHLTTFSCDKLFGGPQAGVIVGDKKYVDTVAAHPLYRALRPGRLIFSALQEVMAFYLRSEGHGLPAWSMLKMTEDDIKKRAETFQKKLSQAGIECAVEKGSGAVGGGAMPDDSMPSYLIAVKPPDIEGYMDKLRFHETPIIPRVYQDKVYFDLRTVSNEEESVLFDALKDLEI